MGQPERSLLGHLERVQAYADEVAFYQMIRVQLVKTQRREMMAEDKRRRQG